jgi:GntR family transcriptional repressor for pyruvate dehydrogenase complex
LGERRLGACRLSLALITDGRLETGHSLPSEAEMAAQLGVSRPTIREALRELQNALLISRQSLSICEAENKGISSSSV